MCLVGVAFLSSCDPEEPVVQNPEPTITIMASEGFITGTVDNPTVIDLYEPVATKFGFKVESNAETNKELKSLKVVYEYDFGDEEGPVTEDTIIDLSGMTSFEYIDDLAADDERIIIETLKVTATVTDVDNLVNTATIAMQFDLPPIDLINTPLEWVRKGANLLGNTENEMKALGLKWTGSYKDIMATWEILDENVTMWICDGADYATIETDLDKYAYFANLLENEPLTAQKYRNIGTAQSADYNDMLAIMTEEDFFLIHVTRAEIETFTNIGTQITVKGEWK